MIPKLAVNQEKNKIVIENNIIFYQNLAIILVNKIGSKLEVYAKTKC